MFNEFRALSTFPFSLYGPYRNLIIEMIDHMQNGNGKIFRSPLLNQALKKQITEDTSNGSSLLRIKLAIEANIDKINQIYPTEKAEQITIFIRGGKLPKFDQSEDNFNGMGITVHDTWATHITINSLTISGNAWRAVIHYKTQDHFGLDEEDISKWKFRQWRFFRLWFVLQRYSQFAYRPFITEMEATVEVGGLV
ncbi:hypothetical protein DDT56_16035 [Brenneria corticis]|uniref:DUF3289 domain-containing protein n=1 Tax=Brenneria corticis TaxID=2173106 RepID=A0A2U1TU66_9GAMM|nr:DUF3289 family protein [Brenneria sp. CFCC 11842]PWC12940.1 hypothetical protein DDT56_16035 [Brenneria sp. CFCC 11842]